MVGASRGVHPLLCNGCKQVTVLLLLLLLCVHNRACCVSAEWSRGGLCLQRCSWMAARLVLSFG